MNSTNNGHHTGNNEHPDATTPSGTAVPTTTLLFLAIGTLLLIACAAALPHLTHWSDQYGNIPVFLGFFLLMSLAGRWFWTGIDAIHAAITGNR
ncbi:hypothetical protein HUN08_03105 [Gordonia sp. X0973]|uniref:hypothetical protein n=1 Tax=Gordonia sp. X0973 TaxID=2742602 RepID=UPI000F543E82|nr:hypothetical protein [Gordonia sp. X0973]QKT06299.1 hypothetical protein HUN08_03105 [Gordonia sp. X0973]